MIVYINPVGRGVQPKQESDVHELFIFNNVDGRSVAKGRSFVRGKGRDAKLL